MIHYYQFMKADDLGLTSDNQVIRVTSPYPNFEVEMCDSYTPTSELLGPVNFRQGSVNDLKAITPLTFLVPKSLPEAGSVLFTKRGTPAAVLSTTPDNYNLSLRVNYLEKSGMDIRTSGLNYYSSMSLRKMPPAYVLLQEGEEFEFQGTTLKVLRPASEDDGRESIKVQVVKQDVTTPFFGLYRVGEGVEVGFSIAHMFEKPEVYERLPKYWPGDVLLTELGSTVVVAGWDYNEIRSGSDEVYTLQVMESQCMSLTTTPRNKVPDELVVLVPKLKALDTLDWDESPLLSLPNPAASRSDYNSVTVLPREAERGLGTVTMLMGLGVYQVIPHNSYRSYQALSTWFYKYSDLKSNPVEVSRPTDGLQWSTYDMGTFVTTESIKQFMQLHDYYPERSIYKVDGKFVKILRVVGPNLVKRGSECVTKLHVMDSEGFRVVDAAQAELYVQVGSWVCGSGEHTGTWQVCEDLNSVSNRKGIVWLDFGLFKPGVYKQNKLFTKSGPRLTLHVEGCKPVVLGCTSEGEESKVQRLLQLFVQLNSEAVHRLEQPKELHYASQEYGVSLAWFDAESTSAVPLHGSNKEGQYFRTKFRDELEELQNLLKLV